MKKTTLSLFILSLLMTNAFAENIIARVSEVSGDAFVFQSSFDSKVLSYGDKLRIGVEVMVDDSSHITLVDEIDNIYHVSGGSHLSFSKNGIIIKNGKVWIKANGKKTSELEALHSSIQFKEGQFIVDTDNLNDKTQVMVMTGHVNFYNPLEPTLITKIDSGQFSFISPKFESGIPRMATRIGMESYKTLKLAFSNIESTNKYKTKLDPLEKKSVKRSIASVKPVKEGKIIFFKASKKSRKVASTSPYEYFKNMKKKKVAKKDICHHPSHKKTSKKVVSKQRSQVKVQEQQEENKEKIAVKMYDGTVSQDELRYYNSRPRAARIPSSVRPYQRQMMKQTIESESDIVSEINSLDI